MHAYTYLKLHIELNKCPIFKASTILQVECEKKEDGIHQITFHCCYGGGGNVTTNQVNLNK